MATVEAPRDGPAATMTRDAAIAVMLPRFAGEPDIVSVRVEYQDEQGRHLARAVLDTSECTQEMATDAGAMARFHKSHLQME
jgi:hypothetical protein